MKNLNQNRNKILYKKTLHQLFQQQIKKNPQKIAVIDDNQSLTYQELDEQSNQLARFLRNYHQVENNQSFKNSNYIILCLERSVDLLVSILAILKSGGIYVPIDPETPVARMRFIVNDVKPRLLLGYKGIRKKLRNLQDFDKNFKIILIDDCKFIHESKKNLPNYNSANDLAYVIYTSGTTGYPKGVMMTHKSANNVILAQIPVYQLNELSKVYLAVSCAFDVSILAMFSALLSGSSLYISKQIGINKELIEKYAVTHLTLPVALLPALQQIELNSIQTLVLGGEKLGKKVISFLLTKIANIVYEYGVTEACITNTYRILKNKKNINIGRPIANTKVYILNKNLQLAKRGEIGEIYISGLGLACGYLNRPELTKEKFLDNFLASETDKKLGYSRLYKTGDLGRYLSDGNIEFIGRDDDQVKINGYRIEISEIENTLLQLPEIYQAIVVVKIKKTGGLKQKSLIVFFTSQVNSKFSEKSLMVKLAKILPNYMIPNKMIQLDSFPLTRNGKIDSNALLKLTAIKNKIVLLPRNEIEIILCKIWQDLLGLKQVGIKDNFFKIGGNSILAIQLAHILTEKFNIKISVVEIFNCKTIFRLSGYIIKAPKSCNISIEKSIKPPLSYSQQGLLFIEHYEAGTNAYHIPFLLRLSKTIKNYSLIQALQALVGRHQILNSIICQDKKGIYYQRVLDRKIQINEYCFNKIQDLNSHLIKDINKPFKLHTERPIRIKIYQLNSNKKSKVINYLFINVHHIAFDGWSINIFFQELYSYYLYYLQNEMINLSPVIQYKNYATWQRKEAFKKQTIYWQDKLEGFTNLILQTDKPRPSHINYQGDEVIFKLSAEVSNKIRNIIKKLDCTLYTFLLGAFYLLLYNYTEQKDLIIGTPMANRKQREFNNTIGVFVNSVPLRTIIDPQKKFFTFIQDLQNNLIDIQKYEELPFEKLVDVLKIEKDPSCHPIFQIMFGICDSEWIFTNKIKKILIPVNIEKNFKVAKFDLSLFIDCHQAELICNFNYATSLFDRPRIERMSIHYQYILLQLSTQLNNKISQIKLLTPKEVKALVYSKNKLYLKSPRTNLIHQLFELQVRKFPSQIAVAFDNQNITYQELNYKANQLARYIQKKISVQIVKEKQKDIFIALCLERSIDMVIAILAVLKSGYAYVPISPTYPLQRVHYILADTQAKLIITQAHVSKIFYKIDQINNSIVKYSSQCVIMDDKLYTSELSDNLLSYNQADSLAYVIYTSGTTGQPKGVLQTHFNVLRLFTATNNWFRFNHKDRWTLFHSYTFDFSIWELFGALLFGGRIIIPTEIQLNDTFQFYQLLINQQITVLNQTPSAFKQLLWVINKKKKAKLDSLKFIIFGGEALNLLEINSWWNKHKVGKPKLINMYGITEITVHATYKELHPIDSKLTVSNIGKRLSDLTIYILNEHGNPVSAGVEGELYIGGNGLARGYLNQPSLTATKFIKNKFVTKKQNQLNKNIFLYKTGDRALWLENGEIGYLGRKDLQIKLRGFRIELEEVEKALITHPAVQHSIVILYKSNDLNKEDLVAYCVLKNFINIQNLREYLIKLLPHYMIPSYFIILESLPLTLNGKINKNILPNPYDQLSIRKVTSPKTNLEIELCKIWKKVLSVKNVDIADNFFLLGGNSILAMRTVFLAKNKFSLADLFTHPILKDLAEFILKKNNELRYLSNLSSKDKGIKEDSIIPIICVPFGGGDAADYKFLADELLKINPLCQVMAIELPGYGRKYKGNFSDNELAEKIVQELKELYKFQKIIIYGHCVGSSLAIALTHLLEREKNCEIILTIGGIFLPNLSDQNLSLNPWNRASDKVILNALMELGWNINNLNEEIIRYIIKNFRQDVKRYQEYFCKNSEIALNIRSKLYYIIGDQDKITNQVLSKTKIPSEKIIIIKGVGHYFLKSNPLALAEKIIKLLSLNNIACNS